MLKNFTSRNKDKENKDISESEGSTTLKKIKHNAQIALLNQKSLNCMKQQINGSNELKQKIQNKNKLIYKLSEQLQIISQANEQ